jgi:hypothetical protein
MHEIGTLLDRKSSDTKSAAVSLQSGELCEGGIFSQGGTYL